jgi:hypothetical protein
MEADKANGVAIDPRGGRRTLSKHAEAWLEGATLRPRTVELYDDLLRKLILPDFGDVAFSRIRLESVRIWNKRLRKSKPSQAPKAYRLLSTIMKAAVEDGLIASNPCRVKGAGKEHPKETEFVEPETVDQLAATISSRLSALVFLLAYAGPRKLWHFVAETLTLLLVS